MVLLQNGTDYGFLVRQNSELLRALDKLEKTCNALREENGLLVGLKITLCVCVCTLDKRLLKVGQAHRTLNNKIFMLLCSVLFFFFFYRN